MIQGGGFEPRALKQKKVEAPIKNEGDRPALKERPRHAGGGAHQAGINSATAQFFIKPGRQQVSRLHAGAGNYGYAVFGKVASGMDAGHDGDRRGRRTAATRAGHQRNVPSADAVVTRRRRRKQ